MIARPVSKAADIQKQVADSAASIFSGTQFEAMPMRLFSYHRTGMITTAAAATLIPSSDDSGLMPRRNE